MKVSDLTLGAMRSSTRVYEGEAEWNRGCGALTEFGKFNRYHRYQHQARKSSCSFIEDWFRLCCKNMKDVC